MNTGPAGDGAGRTLRRVIPARRAADGDGVRLYRSIGGTQANRVDPFLLLDEFCSDDPDDYIGGFPPHPHRGFATVTIMRHGRMRHEDHMGNVGELGPGDVQWMRAGRGVVHSEMPRQEQGLMHGFQLWINLPAAHKMDPPAWQDIPAARIPQLQLDDARLRLIAGVLQHGGAVHRGPMQDPHSQAVIAELALPPGGRLTLSLPPSHQVVLYPFEGEARLGPQRIARRHAAWLGGEGPLRLAAGDQGLGALLLAARPLGEPVVQYGPFVMNTPEQIGQTLRDWREGRLTG